MPTDDAKRVLSVRFVLERPNLHLDVTFTATPGITALVGPSGVGKSTTLSVIAGAVPADRASLRLGDEVWQEEGRPPRVPIHERRVGFVFQTPALFPHLDVEGNVAFGIPPVVDKAARAAKVRSALARFSATHLQGRRTPTLSGGEAQRVALARTFAAEPAVVLLDEPLSALDSTTKRAVGDALRLAIEEAGIIAILVSHDDREVSTLATAVLRLEEGRIVPLSMSALENGAN